MPALSPVTAAVLAPVLHKKVFVPVPPVALAVAVPVELPLHPLLVEVILATTAVG